MSDPVTGGGFDGLTPTGPNLNQGAESTLALISTMQHRRSRDVDRWRSAHQPLEQVGERDRGDARADVGVSVRQHE